MKTAEVKTIPEAVFCLGRRHDCAIYSLDLRVPEVGASTNTREKRCE